MQRRDILRSAALATAGLSSLGWLSQNRVLAQSNSDYKALVCVYLFGGNDAHNTLIPYDSALHAQYLSMRPEYNDSSKTGLGVARGALLPLTPAQGGTAEQALHPSLVHTHARWAQGQVAWLQNVGNLVQPLTRSSYNTALRPAGLAAHDEQVSISQLALQDSQAVGAEHGWGARLWRRWAEINGVSPHELAMVSFNGRNRWQTSSLQALSALQANTTLTLDYPTQMASLIADGQASARPFTRAYANAQASAYALGAAINSVFSVTSGTAYQTFMQTTGNQASSLLGQLLAVARFIEARQNLAAPQRQIFFVGLGGFDTHSNQYAGHAKLLTTLDQALHGFMSAMEALGLSQQVTAFTLSDFSRTLRMDASNGTDHAWAGHSLVMGGAVQGGLYGRAANLEPTSEDISPTNNNWVIPSLAVNQVAATLSRWMGLSDSDLQTVFPHLPYFSTANLGFMNV